MKLLSAITIAALAVGSLLVGKANVTSISGEPDNRLVSTTISTNPDFEKAVELIKKYEGLHQPKHYPLVGYGHRVLPGEKFSRSRALSEAEADKLLRKDLLKNCAVFREWGADSLILGVLAYNIGSGNVLKSNVAKLLKAGNRDVYAQYISHARYRGKIHTQIQKRRKEEFEALFIKDTRLIGDNEKEQILEESEQTLAKGVSSKDVFSPLAAFLQHTTEIVENVLSIPEHFYSDVLIPNFSPQGEGYFSKESNKLWMACI
ncbi:MAG: hypothetical protein K2N88_02845 [Muribaculaceae bacterium]|nr:hypothetical protein [Muribaculaceae bacterium]